MMSHNPHSLEGNCKRLKIGPKNPNHRCLYESLLYNLTAGCNLSKLFVDCQGMLTVCFCKYNKCLVLSINCNVTFLTYLIERIWTINSAHYWHVIGNCIPIMKFRDKNAGCSSCAATQQWTCCRYCCSWFMRHWLFSKALLPGNIQRPNTFNYYSI